MLNERSRRPGRPLPKVFAAFAVAALGLCGGLLSWQGGAWQHAHASGFGTVFGSVKKLEKDGGGFTLKSRKGSYNVTWGDDAAVIIHTVKTVGELERDTFVHVLAHRQPPQVASAGGQFPETILRIQTIVVAPKSFKPLPVTEKMTSQKIKWHTGKLRLKGKEYQLGATPMILNSSRQVLVIGDGKKSDIRKRQNVLVTGEVTEERRKKSLLAVKVEGLAAKFPMKEYPLILNLSPKPPKPGKKKEPEGDLPDDF